jgi:hypothetical protein
MRIAVTVVAFVVWIGTNNPALVNFKEGWEAFNTGDYASAYDGWFPLGERGDAHAQYNFGVLPGGHRWNGDESELGTVPLAGPPDADRRTAVTHALAKAPGQPALALSCPADQVLTRRFSLPAAAAKTLHQAAGFEMAPGTDLNHRRRLPELGGRCRGQ